MLVAPVSQGIPLVLLAHFSPRITSRLSSDTPASILPFRSDRLFVDPSAEPTGDLLPDVIAEALRQGAVLLASPPACTPSISSSSFSSRSQVAAFTVHENGQDKDSKSPSPSLLQSSGGGDSDSRKLGETIVAELSARAERSGWNSSVLFLEKAGAVRLRLVHRSEEGGGSSEGGAGSKYES